MKPENLRFVSGSIDEKPEDYGKTGIPKEECEKKLRDTDRKPQGRKAKDSEMFLGLAVAEIEFLTIP